MNVLADMSALRLSNASSPVSTFGSPPPAKRAGLAENSPLYETRLTYKPRVSGVLQGAFSIVEGEETGGLCDGELLRELFPCLFGQRVLHFVPGGEGGVGVVGGKRLGVVLSGGPAPGGHNVIAGMLDYVGSAGVLIGFLGGPDGLVQGKYLHITPKIMSRFRNTGGFHMVGSGRTKIESIEQFAAVRRTVAELELDGIVVVGGDDSNSNAMKLAEDFKSHGMSCSVIGAPKTIDNDLRNDNVEASFGFDTAAKSYANLVGNLGFDAVSAGKAYHFVRVMGRSASHIALEVALQTHPNLTLIGEETAEHSVTLTDVVRQIADVVCERAELGKNYGLIVLPEGLVEFMPDVEELIVELNELLAAKAEMSYDECMIRLSPGCRVLYALLPVNFALQLTLERDSHGNVPVASIEVERLLISMVAANLAKRKKRGDFVGKFNGIAHYLGYEARCALPTLFDSNYTYGLGIVAAALCCNGNTGYVATLNNLTASPEQWVAAGHPLTSMMNIERRKGRDVAVIKKKLVELDSGAFTYFKKHRDNWRLHDDFRNPGPIQFFGPGSEDVTITLALDTAATKAAASHAN